MKDVGQEIEKFVQRLRGLKGKQLEPGCLDDILVQIERAERAIKPKSSEWRVVAGTINNLVRAAS